LDDLGDPVEADDPLVEVGPTAVPVAVRCSTTHLVLELQARFPGRVGEGLDPAVVDVSAAVEDHPGDPGLDRPLGDLLADRLGRAEVVLAGLEVQGRGRRQGPPGGVVDHLRIGVGGAPEHGQPRPLSGSADLPANPAVAAHPRPVPIRLLEHASYPYLPFESYLALPALPALRRIRSPRY